MRKYNVLFVLNDMLNGGTEAFVMNYYRALDRSKVNAEFLAVSAGENYYEPEIASNGDTVYNLAHSNSRDFHKRIQKLLDFFDLHKFDIIHINSCSLKFMVQVAFTARVKKAGIVIGHAHSIGEPTSNVIDSFLRAIMKNLICLNLDYGMACSADSANAKYTSKFINSNKYCILPNAIDTNKYIFDQEKRKKIREQYNLTNQYVIGIVGRLDKWKNQKFLLEAVQIANRTSDVFVMIIGDGDEREEQKQKAAALGIMDKVIFTGAVGNVNDYYSTMDLFCLPSYAEGFPFVLVEAQTNGLKCLISSEITKETDISGTSEYLPIEDPAVWAESILRNKCSRISEAAVQKVIELYDIAHAARRLEELYTNMIKDNTK